MRQVKSPLAAAATRAAPMKKSAPALFLCPISLEIMRDPVIVCTGQTYDRQSIEKWIKDGHRSCPITRLQLQDLTLIPNIIVRQLIEAWSAADDSTAAMFAIDGGDHRSASDSWPAAVAAPPEILDGSGGVGGGGSREQVLGLLRIIASGSGGGGNVRNAVSRLRSMVRKEEQDDICPRNVCDAIVEAGGALLLASLLADRSCCSCSSEEEDSSTSSSTSSSAAAAAAVACEEVLALLRIICRGVNARGVANAVAEESGALDAVMSHLKQGTPATALSAAMLLKRLLAASEEIRATVAKAPGFFRALLDLIDHGGGDGGGGATRRKSLVKLLHLACTHKPSRVRAVEQGAIATLVRLLGGGAAAGGGSGATTNERALAALEVLCGVEQGRVAAAATAVPTVVRMLLGQSRQCTEHSTACLLLLCQSGPVETLETAVRAGAGRQLLLLLQSDCTGRAKRKALELLKLFHATCEPGMRISSPDSSKNGMDVLY